LRALLETTEKNYLWGYDLAVKTQEHTDKMLTWAIGLMGGGLYGAYALLQCDPTHLWIWALLPWLMGILCALAGRLIEVHLLRLGSEGMHQRVSRVQLLMLETDGPLLSRNVQELFHNLFPAETASERLLPWAQRTYYATHVLFGVGILSVGLFVVRQSFHGACK
jgi:hypothetical protein